MEKQLHAPSSWSPGSLLDSLRVQATASSPTWVLCFITLLDRRETNKYMLSKAVWLVKGSEQQSTGEILPNTFEGVCGFYGSFWRADVLSVIPFRGCRSSFPYSKPLLFKDPIWVWFTGSRRLLSGQRCISQRLTTWVWSLDHRAESSPLTSMGTKSTHVCTHMHRERES